MSNKTTIIPPPPGLWPLELVITDLVQSEIDDRENGVFERLEIEHAYNPGQESLDKPIGYV